MWHTQNITKKWETDYFDLKALFGIPEVSLYLFPIPLAVFQPVSRPPGLCPQDPHFGAAALQRCCSLPLSQSTPTGLDEMGWRGHTLHKPGETRYSRCYLIHLPTGGSVDTNSTDSQSYTCNTVITFFFFWNTILKKKKQLKTTYKTLNEMLFISESRGPLLTMAH